jgi:hypothetical protein
MRLTFVLSNWMMDLKGADPMTLQLDLPPDLEQFVAAQARTEGHANVDAFVLDVLRRLHVAKTKADLEVKLLIGMDQLDRGEGRPMGQADWTKMRADHCQRHGIADEA